VEPFVLVGILLDVEFYQMLNILGLVKCILVEVDILDLAVHLQRISKEYLI
jgi:hypothetical protein